MTYLRDLLKNVYLWSAILSWFTAQSVKIFLKFLATKKVDLSLYSSTGGMPSAHTATVIALAVSVGKHAGFATPTFAVAAIFALVVITDAMNLRREVGLHAKELEKIAHKKFNTSSGHKPSEVMVGFLIGLLFGWML